MRGVEYAGTGAARGGLDVEFEHGLIIS
jgi:hypothetical protein